MTDSTLDVRRRVASLSRTPPHAPSTPQEAEGCSSVRRLRGEQVSLSHALREQRNEILKHRDFLSAEWGRPVCLDEAARDWISYHAAAWRARHDSAGALPPST
jgi:hypothetical protein